MKTRLESLPPNIRRRVEESMRSMVPREKALPAHQSFEAHAPAPAAHSKPRGTVCYADGIRFPSKTQLRVYLRLKSEIQPPLTLFIEPRIPVFNLAPNERLRPLYVTPDFAVWDGTKIVRIVDAKPKNRKAHSRDWHRGKRALEACIGIRVEEVDR